MKIAPRVLGFLLCSVTFVSLGCATSRPERVTVTSRDLGEVKLKAAEITASADNDRERARLLFDFVRDEVEYGFTRHFDEADPAFTLEKARGHCNPQTELLVAMMRSVGLEARQRFVTIDADILDGLLPNLAKPLEELNHSYAEVRIDGEWLRIDGYAVDPALWLGGRQRLMEEGRVAGYGVHLESCNRWNGEDDCMGQFVDPEWTRQLHGPIEPARRFYRGPEYTQRMAGLTGFLYRNFGVSWMNRKLDKIRRQAPAETATRGVD